VVVQEDTEDTFINLFIHSFIQFNSRLEAHGHKNTQ